MTADIIHLPSERGALTRTAINAPRPGRYHIALYPNPETDRTNTHCGLRLWQHEDVTDADIFLNAEKFCKRCLKGARVLF